MKKLFLTLVFISAAFISQAQLFIGGNIGAKFTNGKSNSTIVSPDLEESSTAYLTRTNTFDFRPMVGYEMSDNVRIGLRLGYTNVSVKECSDPSKPNYDTKSVYSQFGFAPFFRYTFINVGNFRIFADAELPVSFVRGKNIYKGEDEVITTKAPKEFNIGLVVVPGLMYEISEHLAFTTELGLLNLGFIHNRVKDVQEFEEIETTATSVQKKNEFGIGINNHVQATIGFIYTF